MGGGNLPSIRYPVGFHPKTSSNLKIPIYEKLLNTVAGYEEAIVLNQILYFYQDGTRGFSIHDIARFCSYTKSIATLRKRLESLCEKGFIERLNSFYRGLTYYKPCGELAIDSKELASLIEKRDLIHGDYYTAALINYFRQRKLAGEKEILVSHQELASILQTDVGRLSIRKRIKELCMAGILKSTIIGRATKYTLPDQLLPKEINLETLESQSSELADYYTGHLVRFSIRGKAENYILSFKRLLIDGFDYNKLKLIMSYLGVHDNPYREKVTSVRQLSQLFDTLYGKATVAISKVKSDKYLYKLVNGHLKPICKTTKTTPIQWSAKTIQHDNVVDASGSPASVTIQTPQSQVPENILSKEEIWAKAMEYCENRRKLIYAFYFRYTSSASYANIVDKEEAYNAVLYLVFDQLHKHPEKETFSSNYLSKIVRSILSTNYAQSNIDIAEDMLEDTDTDIVAEDNQEDGLDNNRYADTIKAQFTKSQIPDDITKMIIDYFALDGMRYSQRELAKKYNKSVATTNRILTKYVGVLKELMRDSDPPL